VVRQLIVELWSQGLQLGEIAPCDVWEIVMLVMVAHVESKHVERTVVGVGFYLACENVMFREEVSSARVK